jgi:hypothetical protein
MNQPEPELVEIESKHLIDVSHLSPDDRETVRAFTFVRAGGAKADLDYRSHVAPEVGWAPADDSLAYFTKGYYRIRKHDPKAETTTEEYVRQQNERDFQIGDIVSVLQKVEGYTAGWKSTWVGPMDDAVRSPHDSASLQLYEIVEDRGYHGLTLRYVEPSPFEQTALSRARYLKLRRASGYVFPHTALSHYYSPTRREYLRSHKICGIEVGDTVLVKRVPETTTEGGWAGPSCELAKNRQNRVGEPHKVLEDRGVHGFKLKPLKSGALTAFWPCFVLQKITPEKLTDTHRPWTPEEAINKNIRKKDNPKGISVICYVSDTDEGIQFHATSAGVYTPENVLKWWEQLDGSPCGVPKEDDVPFWSSEP